MRRAERIRSAEFYLVRSPGFKSFDNVAGVSRSNLLDVILPRLCAVFHVLNDVIFNLLIAIVYRPIDEDASRADGLDKINANLGHVHDEQMPVGAYRAVVIVSLADVRAVVPFGDALEIQRHNDVSVIDLVHRRRVLEVLAVLRVVAL